MTRMPLQPGFRTMKPPPKRDRPLRPAALHGLPDPYVMKDHELAWDDACSSRVPAGRQGSFPSGSRWWSVQPAPIAGWGPQFKDAPPAFRGQIRGMKSMAGGV